MLPTYDFMLRLLGVATGPDRQTDTRHGRMGGWEDTKWQTIGGSIYLIYHVLTVTILICYEVNGLRNGTGYKTP